MYTAHTHTKNLGAKFHHTFSSFCREIYLFHKQILAVHPQSLRLNLSPTFGVCVCAHIRCEAMIICAWQMERNVFLSEMNDKLFSVTRNTIELHPYSYPLSIHSLAYDTQVHISLHYFFFLFLFSFLFVGFPFCTMSSMLLWYVTKKTIIIINIITNKMRTGQQDAIHITAILGESVVFNCHVEFPGDHPVPYVLQWEKKVSETVRHLNLFSCSLNPIYYLSLLFPSLSICTSRNTL